jgi:hypothetical protein
MDKETASETLEESIFKTLNHQKRRDILQVIGEKKTVRVQQQYYSVLNLNKNKKKEREYRLRGELG